MSAFLEAELAHLDDETADRVRRLFDVTAPLEADEWPHEHAPGEARPVEGPLPIALEDAEEGVW